MEKLIIRKDFTPKGDVVISFSSNISAEGMRFSSRMEYRNFLCLLFTMEYFDAITIERSI